MRNTTKISIRFSDEEVLILKNMAAKENTTLSALCRNHILYGENAGLAIREENVQQRIDDVESKIEAMGSLLAEINQRQIENAQNNSSVEELFKLSFSALARRVEEAIKAKS